MLSSDTKCFAKLNLGGSEMLWITEDAVRLYIPFQG